MTRRRESSVRESEAGGSDGLFVVFEGVEGAGKSTHLQLLGEHLSERGVPHRIVREPGGTDAGERIRRVVLDADLEVAPRTELLLMLAARAEFVERLVRPALREGEVVLADRYELSTFAYQGVARGLGLDRVRELNGFATDGLRPDALVLLDVSAETGLRRKSGEPHPDRMEREDADFHRAVAGAYRRLADEEGASLAATPDGLIRVPAEEGTAAVHRRIREALHRRWPETFGSPAG